MANLHPTRIAQNPILPWELTDAIIDLLRYDVRALGVCGTVCSEWLIRSRYHAFSTVQLWPWRVKSFLLLASDEKCTFNNLITRIEMDDARVKSCDLASAKHIEVGDEDANVMFSDAIFLSVLQWLAPIKAMQIRNVDWTSLTPTQQSAVRTQLSQFSSLCRLEFQDVIFHDIRELSRILRLFGPSLNHVTANVSFLKYPEYNIALTTDCSVWASGIRSMEIGTDEGISVLLSFVANHCRTHQQGLQELKLRNVERNHLQYIENALRNSGKNLHRLSLGFNHEKAPFISEDNPDLSNLNNLRALSIRGLQVNSSSIHVLMERCLPKILERIEAAFFVTLELDFHLQGPILAEDMKSIDWTHIRRVLLLQHFFGLTTLRIRIITFEESPVLLARCLDREIRSGLGELLCGEVLDLRVVCESAASLGDAPEAYIGGYSDKE